MVDLVEKDPGKKWVTEEHQPETETKVIVEILCIIMLIYQQKSYVLSLKSCNKVIEL